MLSNHTELQNEKEIAKSHWVPIGFLQAITMKTCKNKNLSHSNLHSYVFAENVTSKIVS